MSALALSASFDGPSPVLSRVEAHLARAEARDRVFVTIPVTMLRALLAFAGVAAREIEGALLEAMTAAEQIPAEHRAAYLAARMEQLAIAHGMAPGGARQPRKARKAIR